MGIMDETSFNMPSYQHPLVRRKSTVLERSDSGRKWNEFTDAKSLKV